MLKLVDDTCIVHDLSDGDLFVVSISLCHTLYRLDAYDKCVNDATYSISYMQAMYDAKLWHACFGHLNFSSLLCLHKNDMVLLLPHLKAPQKHVREGFILGKMQRA